MNLVLKSIKFGLIICISLHVIGLIVAILLVGVEQAFEDFQYIIRITVPLFFLPCFYASIALRLKTLIQTKDNLKNGVLLIILSFVSIYLIIFFVFRTKNNESLHFLNIASLFNGIIAIIVSVFSLLILYLVNKPKKTQIKLKSMDISLWNVLVIWLIISVLYYIVLFTLGGTIISPFIINTCFLGLINSIIAFGVFRYYNMYSSLTKGVLVFILYVLGLIGLPFISLLITPLFGDRSVFIKIIQSVTIISPYFLLSTLAIHAYCTFLKTLSDKNRYKQLTISAKLKYNQLLSQLSPHFLFNNISVLTGLIEENQTKAIAFSQTLSNIYRHLLDFEKEDLIPLYKELNFVNDYLELLKTRFHNGIQFENFVSYSHNYYILPLALQQVIENIFKHNEASIEQSIVIKMNIIDDYLIISNTLNPKLFSQSNSQLGIKNIVERYEFFTDREVVIEKTEENYTIKLPLLKLNE